MNRPKLLDLFCGSGGAAMGYHRAGFDVFGVDLDPKPLRHYPFPHVCADALEYLAAHGSEYDAIHASPPCQRYTSLKAMWNAREHPDLVAVTRKLLMATGKPWILENVPGAPLLSPIVLCGSMFRLGCDGAELRRHRLFETSFPLAAPCSCQHGWSGAASATIGVYGHAGGRDRRRRKNGQHFPTSARAQAMGIDWMTGNELSQAIPPAYTTSIGTALLAHMCVKA